MKLTDLTPRYYGAGGPGITKADGTPAPHRKGVGLSFDCPCGCGKRRHCDFSNPLDGGAPLRARPQWERIGDDFQSMTLSPSIYAPKNKGGCGWHGWLKNGELTGAVEP